MSAIGLKSHIWNNNLRSLFLLGSYPLLLCGLAWAAAFAVYYGLGTSNGYYSAGQGSSADQTSGAVNFAGNFVWEFWPAILAIAAIWFLIAYFFQTRMIRGAAHAHPVNRSEEPELYNMLENLCISRGLTMPRLEIIETDALNAFASGVDDRTYCVTVTRGLLQSMQKDEIEAVLAHELTHIINRDVRLLIVSIIFTGMIGFLAQLVWSSIRYSMYAGTVNRRRNNGSMFLVMLAVAVILWIGYMATIFTRFALSRRREFMADAGAVELTKNPEGMMRALMRLAGKDRIPGAPDDIALMCIENSRKFFGLFTTHPPLEARIAAISEVTNTPVPQLSGSGAQKEKAQRASPWNR